MSDPLFIPVPSAEAYNKLSGEAAALKAEVAGVQGELAEAKAEIAESKAQMAETFAKVATLEAALKKVTRKSELYIPLYIWPTQTVSGVRSLNPHWQAVVDCKKMHPELVIIAVINPDNGNFNLGRDLLSQTLFDGARPNIDFAYGIQKLAEVGVIVAGYIYTDYGQRAHGIIEQRGRLYQKLYPQVSKIMLDEMESENLNLVQYYKTVTTMLKALGFDEMIGNPGAPCRREFIGSVDCIIIYESVGLCSLTELSRRTFNGEFDRFNFGVTPHSVTAYDSTWVREAAKCCGRIYLTPDSTNALTSPDKDSNPWNMLSPYCMPIAVDLLAFR